VIALTRRYRFPAAHVLRSPELSDAENARVYGKCANPNGHGHDYGLEISVTGPVDPRTGHILDPARLDSVVGERVLRRFDHRLLNDDPLFARAVPTAENIARAVYRELDDALRGEAGARLLRVRVVETRRNHFDCGAMP
jgi:6-pyruvoyltetrahydropterin/6-carboxytetrahydropterin synthase